MGEPRGGKLYARGERSAHNTRQGLIEKAHLSLDFYFNSSETKKTINQIGCQGTQDVQSEIIRNTTRMADVILKQVE